MKSYFKFIFIIIILTVSFVPIQAQNSPQVLLTRINGLRSELGLSPYTTNSALTSAAQSHAQWMVDTQQVTHVQDNGSSPQSRAQANGYNSRWVSENIYMGGLASVDTAWTFWINSPIHYRGLTSTNFQDIGIATAQGEGGQAFVLVFGVPPNSSSVIASSGSGNSSASNANAPSAPPLAIVGYDGVGNIQYEMQAGDTLGDVLLLFGYTWDDLNNLLDLNSFTDDDIRSLSVGQVVLVPPPQGTYTPTPLTIEATEEIVSAETTNESVDIVLTETIPTIEAPTTEAIDITPTIETIESLPTAIQTPVSQTSGIIPTLVPNDTEENTVNSDEALGQPVTFVAVSASATRVSTATAIPTLQINNQVPEISVAQVNTPIPIIENSNVETANSSSATPSNRPPLWLIGAIVLQVGILGFATVEYFRRQRR